MSAPTDESIPTRHLVREIAGDVSSLVRKEVELSRQELEESLQTWLRAVAAIALAAVLGTAAIVLVGFAAVGWLDDFLPDWGASLVVAATAALAAGSSVLYARRAMRRGSIVPEETRRTVQEDFEWAKTQLKR